MFLCYHYKETYQACVGSSANEVYQSFKDTHDEYVSLDDLVFIEIPEGLPRAKYKMELVEV